MTRGPMKPIDDTPNMKLARNNQHRLLGDRGRQPPRMQEECPILRSARISVEAFITEVFGRAIEDGKDYNEIRQVIYAAVSKAANGIQDQLGNVKRVHNFGKKR